MNGPRSARFFSNAAGATADTFADSRQPLIGHLCRAIGATEDEARVSVLLQRLENAGVDMDELAAIVRENADDMADIVARLVRVSMKLEGGVGEIGWLPLQSLVKFSDDGTAIGFKGMPELDRHLNAWRGRVQARHVADGIPGVPDLRLERFVESLQILDDTIERNPRGVPIGFKGSAADTHEGYIAWILRQVEKTDPNVTEAMLTDAHLLEHSPLQYAQRVRPGKRPAASLEALCGPGLRKLRGAKVKGPPGRGNSSWQNLFPRAWRTPDAGWKEAVLTQLEKPDTLRQSLRDRLRRRYPDHPIDPPGFEDSIGLLEGFLAHAIRKNHVDAAVAAGRPASEALAELPTKIDSLIINHMNEGVLRELMGERLLSAGLHSDEFMERLIDAHDAFGSVLLERGIHWNDPMFTNHGPDIFSLVQKAFTRPGHPNGYKHEIEKAIDQLVDITETQSRKHEKLLLQYDLPTKDGARIASGPDQVISKSDSLRFRQLKSHEKISDLSGYNGKIIQQAGSDLWRALKKAVSDAPAEDAIGTIDDLPDEWPMLSVDGSRKRLENVFESEMDGAWVGHRRADPVETIDWFNKAVKKAKDEFAEINGFLADTSTTATKGNVRAILEQSNVTLGKSGTTIKAALEELLAGEESFTVAEIMILRMLCDRGTDTISAEMISVARKAAKFQPPLEIDFKALEGSVWVYQGLMTAPRVPEGMFNTKVPWSELDEFTGGD